MVDNVTHVPVITLDGPSGTGKGTLCHRLADALGWHVLDSGVLYRALGLLTEKRGILLDALDDVVALAHKLPILFDKEGIMLDGVRVGDELRTEACGARASQLAAIPEVRAALLERQRAFAQHPGLVTDGRDMGTVVFPEADLKIYLDASTEERAKRRYLQLKASGKSVNLAQVVGELAKRDARDMGRAHAPLMAADDAITVDTTHCSVEEVFERLLLLARERGLTLFL
ncbi:MAG: (d)CMP kinase [Legionella sp.]|jgi:cytidylate kinase|nr:(d)CMP kinase [Legionella sp.]